MTLLSVRPQEKAQPQEDVGGERAEEGQLRGSKTNNNK